MRRFVFLMIALRLISTAVLTAGPSENPDRYWPQWRGPDANGVAPHGDPPIEWSEEKNVQWKVEIPGKGSATPIIWGNQIFVSTAVPVAGKVTEQQLPAQQERQTGERPAEGGTAQRQRSSRNIARDQVQQFTLIALNRKDGKMMWKKVLREEAPHEGTHPTGTWASASPTTDGEHVWAFYGSRGLYCLDMNGNLVWEVDLGNMRIRNSFGEGSSPTLAGDRIVVNWDHEGQSFIVALDKETGKVVWQTNRDEISSWSTPHVVEHNGVLQVITSATGLIRSYNLEDGSLIWECEGMTANVIPSPVSSQGIVYLTSGHRGSSLLAIRLDGATGNITGSKSVLWSHQGNTPYVPSPLLFDDSIYFLSRNSGILTRFNVQTGTADFGPERLLTTADIYASPVGAAGRVYIVDREGTTVVLEHGSHLKTLAVNKLEDGFDASPAVVDNEMYLRGKYLYRISEE